jgi:hypothetical protein
MCRACSSAPGEPCRDVTGFHVLRLTGQELAYLLSAAVGAADQLVVDMASLDSETYAKAAEMRTALNRIIARVMDEL